MGAVIQILANLIGVPISLRTGHWLCVLVGLILIACAAVGVRKTAITLVRDNILKYGNCHNYNHTCIG